MKLYIAGGVGEHGRNCFLVNGESISFLVDCGKMADTPLDPYPRLTKEQITSLDAVFLTTQVRFLGCTKTVLKEQSSRLLIPCDSFPLMWKNTAL